MGSFCQEQSFAAGDPNDRLWSRPAASFTPALTQFRSWRALAPLSNFGHSFTSIGMALSVARLDR